MYKLLDGKNNVQPQDIINLYTSKLGWQFNEGCSH